MWKKNKESIDHLLLHCDVARDIWSFFYSLFGVKWVMLRRVLDLLSSWGSSLGHGQVQKIWKQVPLCVMWGFGVRGMHSILKMWKCQVWSCVVMCLIHYLYGSRLIAQVVLPLQSF